MNRIDIDRLELDLRGIDPAVAEAAVRLLGPALQAALAAGATGAASSAHIDAGRIVPPADAGGLAQQLAQRIGGAIGAGRPEG
jgi:hypothetical protein